MLSYEQAKSISITDFSYQLPNEKIALEPLAERDTARLLVYNNGDITDSNFQELPEELHPNDLLVFNQTKVVHARLHFQKPSGATLEIFCLSPAENLTPASALTSIATSTWHCMVGGLQKWKEGEILEARTTHLTLQASLISKGDFTPVVKFTWQPQSKNFSEVLQELGAVPLPPYIKRKLKDEDKKRYQTVFAKEEGSVAAPTAALHFSEELLADLKKHSIQFAYNTLHVGAGTFAPVKASLMGGHQMHEEWMLITLPLIETLLQAQHHIIAVGTTSLRFLESMFWMGNALCNKESIDWQHIAVTQWQPYKSSNIHSTKEALTALKRYMLNAEIEEISTRTQLLILPGYSFKMVEALITNFHQPNSTLLLLVAAFIGEDWRKVYRHALDNDYRFLSYGDGSLLWRSQSPTHAKAIKQ